MVFANSFKYHLEFDIKSGGEKSLNLLVSQWTIWGLKQ